MRQKVNSVTETALAMGQKRALSKEGRRLLNIYVDMPVNGMLSDQDVRRGSTSSLKEAKTRVGDKELKVIPLLAVKYVLMAMVETGQTHALDRKAMCKFSYFCRNHGICDEAAKSIGEEVFGRALSKECFCLLIK